MRRKHDRDRKAERKVKMMGSLDGEGKEQSKEHGKRRKLFTWEKEEEESDKSDSV